MNKKRRPKLFPFDNKLLFSVNRVYGNGWPEDGKRIVEFGIDCQESPISYCGEPHSANSEWYEINFHCGKHPNMQMTCDRQSSIKGIKLECPSCRNEGRLPYSTSFKTYGQMAQVAIDIFNSPLYNNYQLVRIDDIYVPEAKIRFNGRTTTIKTTDRLPNDCKVVFDIKKDKNGDKLLMLQIFRSNSPKGAQFFIKPSQGQVTSDHNNPNPSEFIAGIVVTLPDRVISQEFITDGNKQ